MDVSVIVPFRDEEAYLDRCITSLLAQTYPAERFEILMVDNGSSDGSVDIVRNCPRARLISEPEPGSYVARNSGAKQARGEILAFIDADCAADPSWLQAIVATLRDNPAAGIVQGDRDFSVDSPILRTLAAYDAEKVAFTCSSCDAEIYFAVAANLAVRRHLFDEVGPFREMRRGADVVFVQDVIRLHTCEVVVHCPEARVRHLEITSLYGWLRKMFVYGKSYERYSTVTSCRPLNALERFQVLRTVARRRMSLVTLALLGPTLLPGMVCYEMGRLAGRWKTRTSRRPGQPE